jgi:hypothetical protein
LNLAQVALCNCFLQQFFLQPLLLDDIGNAELQAGFHRRGGVADALRDGREVQVLLLLLLLLLGR